MTPKGPGRVEKTGITPSLILPHPRDKLGIFDKGEERVGW